METTAAGLRSFPPPMRVNRKSDLRFSLPRRNMAGGAAFFSTPVAAVPLSARDPSRPDSRLGLTEALIRYSSLLLHVASISAAAAAIVDLRRANACQPTPPTATGEEVVSDEELLDAFDNFKSKTFALTVPLRIVALHGSIPPPWIKDFIKAQGRRLDLCTEFHGSLDSIFRELLAASKTGSIQPKSVMAADIVSVGDSWLSSLITNGVIEPVNVEEQEWFKSLNSTWKTYLRRNIKGELDPDGFIWGAPYRWGSMVIAYKKGKLRSHNISPIDDWRDLFRPELKGKIAMVDSPREVIGAVLKHLGALYNTKDLETEVTGGRQAVLHHLKMLQKQVRLFDSKHYLKAFGAGEVWVAVGWSSDVIPAVKRISDVALVVPKSGSSLWADIWAVPLASGIATDRIGGRVRTPSPLIHQWMEFCLQPKRVLPFQQEVVPGASPIDLSPRPPSVRGREGEEYNNRDAGEHVGKSPPELDTNLVLGIPPPEILARCEFLEPLTDKALEDHRWLISNMQDLEPGWIETIGRKIVSTARALITGRRE